MSWGDAEFETKHAKPTSWYYLPHLWFVRRMALVYAGVVVPVVCVWLVWNRPLGHPEWQSGSLSDYVSFMVWGGTAVYFMPMLVYSMACLLLAIFEVKRATENSLVRLGVYTGVLLTFHYCWLVATVFAAPGNWIAGSLIAIVLVFAAATVAVVVLVPLSLTITLAFYMFGHFHPRWLWIVAGVLLALVVAIFVAPETAAKWGTDLGLSFALLFLVSMALSPSFAFFAYLDVSFRLIQQHEYRGQFRVVQLLFVLGWIGAYLGACRAAIQVAIAEYDKLPTTPPGGDCYIATAAARGHRRVVGSWQVSSSGGNPIFVNRQLQTFKAGELAIRAVWPRGHRWMRRIYDWLGPRLAKRIWHPLLADAAYVTLKPLEWATAVVLWLLRIRYPQ